MKRIYRKRARKKLVEDLMWIGIFAPHCVQLFRHLYSHTDISKPMDVIVNELSEDQLNTAIMQVKATIREL